MAAAGALKPANRAYSRRHVRSSNTLSVTMGSLDATGSDSLFSGDSSSLRKRSRQNLRQEIEQEGDAARDFARSKRKRPEPLSFKSSLATVSLPALGSPFGDELQFSFQTPNRKNLDSPLKPAASSRNLKENVGSIPRGLDSPFHTRPNSPADLPLGPLVPAKSHINRKNDNRSRTRTRAVHSKSRTLSTDRRKSVLEPPVERPIPRNATHIRGRLCSLPDIAPQAPVDWLVKGPTPGVGEIPRSLSHTPSFQGVSQNSPFRRLSSPAVCLTSPRGEIESLISGNITGNLLAGFLDEDVVMEDELRSPGAGGHVSVDRNRTPPAYLVPPSVLFPAEELMRSLSGLGLNADIMESSDSDSLFSEASGFVSGAGDSPGSEDADGTSPVLNLPKGYYRARSGTIRVSHPGQASDTSTASDMSLEELVTPGKGARSVAYKDFPVVSPVGEPAEDAHVPYLELSVATPAEPESPITALSSGFRMALSVDPQDQQNRDDREKLWRQGLAVRMRVEDEALGEQRSNESDDELLLTRRVPRFPWIVDEQLWTE